MKHRAIINVSPELLARALHLREGIKIVRARVDFDTGAFQFLLSGPDLPACYEGAPAVRMPHSEVSELFER